jgi:hypothetical protein
MSDKLCEPRPEDLTALLRCLIITVRQAQFNRGWLCQTARASSVEGGTKTGSCRLVDGDFVVAASDVLDEGMTSGKDSSRAETLEAAHRSKPGYEPAMVDLNRVVRILPVFLLSNISSGLPP